MKYFSRKYLSRIFFTKKYTIFSIGIVALLLVGGIFLFHQYQEKKRAEFSTFLKIGFTNDWEYGPRERLKHKLTAQAPVELQKAVQYFNTEFKPDLIVGGGDYIESSSIKKEDAKKQLEEINTIFKTAEAPRVYALGNHDMRSLTKEEVRTILEMPDNHAVIDKGDWRIVVLDTNFNKEDDSDRAEKSYVEGYVSQNELLWLSEALDTPRPVIVFSHHSPVSTPADNGTSWSTNIVNEFEVRKILEERGNVIAVVSGHTPQSYFKELNGIHYFIIDTMVHDSALGAFGTVELEYWPEKREAKMRVHQKGIQPAQYEVEWQYGEKEKDMLPSNYPQEFQREFLEEELF